MWNSDPRGTGWLDLTEGVLGTLMAMACAEKQAAWESPSAVEGQHWLGAKDTSAVEKAHWHHSPAPAGLGLGRQPCCDFSMTRWFGIRSCAAQCHMWFLVRSPRKSLGWLWPSPSCRLLITIALETFQVLDDSGPRELSCICTFIDESPVRQWDTSWTWLKQLVGRRPHVHCPKMLGLEGARIITALISWFLVVKHISSMTEIRSSIRLKKPFYFHTEDTVHFALKCILL